MFKFILFSLFINTTYAFVNYQELSIKNYHSQSDCLINNYYNKTIYKFENNCSCLNFLSCYNNSNNLNITNILLENNISSCLPNNYDYYKCYKCNNSYISLDYKFLNNLCYIYILCVSFFILISFLTCCVCIYIKYKKKNINRVVFVKNYNTF